MDLDSELNNSQPIGMIIRELTGLFNKYVYPELEELRDLDLKDKFYFYIKKIEIIETFFQKKKFPLKDDYNLVFFEAFKKRLIIGWEKHIPKYRSILLFSLLIIKTAINRLFIELNIKTDLELNSMKNIEKYLSNFDLERLIATFVKNFQINISESDKKILESNKKVKKEIDTYQNHVKHYFDTI